MKVQTHHEARKYIKEHRLKVTEVVSVSGKTIYQVVTRTKPAKAFSLTVPERPQGFGTDGR